MLYATASFEGVAQAEPPPGQIGFAPSRKQSQDQVFNLDGY